MIPKPVGRRQEPPGQTALPFQTYCLTRLTRPTRRYRNQSDVGESLRDRQLSFSILRLARPTQPRCRLTVRPSNPLNFALLSKPSDSASPDLLTDAGESTPGQTILSFQVHARRGLPVRHGSSETTVGCRREPPGQTILLFQVLSSARLTRPTRRLLKPPSDVGESLPARQSYLSSLTLGEAYPSNTAGIVPPLDVGESLPARQTHPFRLLARPPVGCRLSIPTKTLPFRLHLSDTVSLDLPSVAGESTPGQTTLPFLVPRWRRLPVQHSGYCAPVGRRREPHSETTYSFPLGRRD